MERSTDVRDYKPTVGAGKDVKDTQMLTGTGKMSAAQNDDNVTVPYETGAAPAFGKLGDRVGGKK